MIFLRGIREDCLDMLNLLRKGDVSKEYFHHTMDLCQRYSKESSIIRTREQDIFTQAQKSSSGGATQEETSNPLKKFEIDMMSSSSSQLDVMREK